MFPGSYFHKGYFHGQYFPPIAVLVQLINRVFIEATVKFIDRLDAIVRFGPEIIEG